MDIETKYINSKTAFENEKKEILQEIAKMIKSRGKFFAFGNMIYATTFDNELGIEVPTYYDKQDKTFQPIYDYNQTYDYGWCDFQQVVNIGKAIKKYIDTH